MSTAQRTGAPARTIDVPSAWIDTPAAFLTIDTSDGETATMALVVNGAPVAVGVDFGCLGHGAPVPEVEQSARMVCTVDGVRFEWSGGAYIELTPAGCDAPTDCVNVWDYATDELTIARTLDAFEARCVAEVER